jgi:hypothetical protein
MHSSSHPYLVGSVVTRDPATGACGSGPRASTATSAQGRAFFGSRWLGTALLRLSLLLAQLLARTWGLVVRNARRPLEVTAMRCTFQDSAMAAGGERMVGTKGKQDEEQGNAE